MLTSGMFQPVDDSPEPVLNQREVAIRELVAHRNVLEVRRDSMAKDIDALSRVIEIFDRMNRYQRMQR